MSIKTKVFIAIGIVCGVICCTAILLGMLYYRLPEALILSGGILIFYISIILFDGYLTKSERETVVAMAGRCIIHVKAFCKHQGVSEQVIISFHSHGVLVQGNTIESSIMEYSGLLVSRTKKYSFRFMFEDIEQDLNETYDVTINSLLEVKAIIQVLQNMSVYIGGTYDSK